MDKIHSLVGQNTKYSPRTKYTGRCKQKWTNGFINMRSNCPNPSAFLYLEAAWLISSLPCSVKPVTESLNSSHSTYVVPYWAGPLVDHIERYREESLCGTLVQSLMYHTPASFPTNAQHHSCTAQTGAKVNSSQDILRGKGADVAAFLKCLHSTMNTF